MKRIYTIDFTRGLVMILMALDHTRDFMHINSLTQNPTDLATTTPILFFTRWITHFCAPVFVFLAGVSAYLFYKTQGDAKTRWFLISRGIWLIVLEFTVINFALWFDWHFRILLFEVIAVIGFGFIILSFLLKLPVRTIGIIGLIILFGHDLFPLIRNGSILQSVLSPLFSLSSYQVTPGFSFVIVYPVIPWLGIMLAGFAAGKLFEFTEAKRKQVFIKIALAAMVLFILLRFINFYGDPSKWSIQENSLYTFLSFINVSKYPPSALFTVMTLGGMFLIFYLAEGVKNKFINIVTVFGKVPLFYFIIHLFLLHTLMIAMLFLQGYHWKDFNFEPFQFGRPKEESGISLGGVYLVWLCVVIFLYPLCKWYGKYKASHKENKWLKYL